MLRKRTITFSEGLNILRFDDNGRNSAEESSPTTESNDSNDHFSANELSTSKKMAQHVVTHVHMAQEEMFEQDHVIDKKNIHPTNSELA